jgi:Undecaprenyl-phosphate glucose phosphotransferase
MAQMYLSGSHSLFSRRLAPNPSRFIRHDALVLSAGFLRAFDIASVPASELIAHYFRYGSVDVSLSRAVLVPLGMIFLANAMALFHAYDHNELGNPRAQVSKVVAGWATAFAMLLAIAFFEKISVYYSRLWVGYWFSLGILFSLGARYVLAAYLGRLKRAGKLTVDVAIVGQTPFVQRVMQRLSKPNDVDVRVVGVFDPSLAPAAQGGQAQGTVDDLLCFARQRRIHEIIVHLPERRDDAFYAMLQKLGELPVNVNLCPDLSDLPIPPRKFTVLREAVMINVYERPLSGWSAILKRMEDIVLSMMLIVFFLPLMVVIAALIKIDSRGPVFFRQLRFGFNNNPISVYKFRTMHVGAASDPVVHQARRNDPRVTRVGRILRRTSLDELPQLINVLRGDMSLVGPRPHAIAHNEYYAKLINGYLNRHRVRPGITGWAQIHGLRGETPTAELMHERVQHDLFYIENWSLWLDMWILLRTLTVGFVHPNAY